jgi:polyhydroxyalkanoate synthesis regulator phasin
MSFNPDEYLKKKRAPAQGFDPDAYLKAKSEPKTDAGQAALEGFGNAATLGYLPQLQAMAEPAMNRVLDAVTGNRVAEGDKSTYIQRRDANLTRQEQQKAEHPYAAGAGALAGTAASVLGTAGLGAVAKGASATQRLAAARNAGLALGAAQNPGDVKGEINPLQIGDRTQNAVVGGLLGMGGQMVAEGAGMAAGAVSKAAKDKAAKKATRALGRPTPTQAREMSRVRKDASGNELPSQDVELGRILLDEGAVPWLGTHGRIAGRVEKIKDKAGEQIGNLVDSAGDAKRVDGAGVGLKMLDEQEVARLRKAPGMKHFASQIDEVANDLAEQGMLSVKEAHQLRRDIDRSIRFNKPAQDRLGTQLALTKSRNALNESMNEAINAIPGAGKDKLLAANRRYSNLSRAEDLAERGVAQDQANRAVSLTDTIVGAAGIANGSLGLAGGLAAVNKASRTFGNSIQARTYDAVGNALSRIPRFSQMAEKNPAGFAAAVERIADRIRPAPQMQPQFAGDPERSIAESKPKRGEALWAEKGAKKLGLDAETAARLEQSKEGKRLLIEASDLPAGSKRLNAIREQLISKEKGKDHGRKPSSGL